MASRKAAPASPSRAGAPIHVSRKPTWLPKYFSSSTLDLPNETGTYVAFHLTPGNRVMHWLSLNVALLAFLVMFACFPLYAPGNLLAPNPSLIILLPLLATYFLMSVRLFQLMLLWLTLFYATATYLAHSLAWFPYLPFAAFNVFAGAFGTQVFIGHRVFEGHDNFSNFSQVLIAFAYFGPLFEGSMVRPLMGREAARKMRMQSLTTALQILACQEWRKRPPNTYLEPFIQQGPGDS